MVQSNGNRRFLRQRIPFVVVLSMFLLPLLPLQAGAAAGSNLRPQLQLDPENFSVSLEEVATAFDQPVHLVDPGDDSDRLFVVEKRGTIRILREDEVLEEAFLDISDQVSGSSEQGLLSLAFHPDFAENGVFVIDYTDTEGDTRVERWRVSEEDPDRADPDSAALIIAVDQPYANHNGGLVLFGPDGNLYIGLGDGGSQGDPDGNAQNIAEPLGAILRITIDPDAPGDDPAYSIPEDNPFVDQADAQPEIWAYGLRNPWRFSFDRETGDFYLGDVGGSAFEEVNVQPADSPFGQNYGWDIMEGFECHEPADCDQSGLVLPVTSYATREFGCSIVGGYVYRGEAMPALNGVYLFADYCSGLMWGMSQAEDGAWIVANPVETGLSISSFGEDADGELYVTDLGGGAYRIMSEA